MNKQLWRRAQKIFTAAGITCRDFLYERSPQQAMAHAAILTPHGAISSSTVVYVHGTGNDGLYPQVKLFLRLLAERYTVFTFDLDGHGQHSTSQATREGLLNCVAAALQEAIRHGCPAPFHLVGHSLGGALALAYAAEGGKVLSPPLASLSLISTPLRVGAYARALAGEALSLLRPEVYQQLAYYSPWEILPACGSFKRSDYPLRLVGEYPAERGRFSYVSWVGELLAHLDLCTRGTLVHLPTLLCYGSLDRIAPLTAGRALAACLPQAEFMAIKGATHFSCLLAHQTEATILAWLDRN